MDSAPPQPPNFQPNSNNNNNNSDTTQQQQEVGQQAAHGPSSVPSSVNQLPPEAIALAGRLFEAARRGGADGEALLGAALQRGLSPNMTNDKGDSLIMLASYHGHASLVRLLLSHNADPNRLNDRGQSPLAGVVFKNERECITALLEGGADPEIGEPSGIDSCRVFKQEEFEQMFLEQIRKLRQQRGEENGNGMVNGDMNGHANGSMNGDVNGV